MKKTSIRLTALACILLFFGSMVTPLQATAPLPESAFDQRISVLMRLSGFRSLAACVIKDDQVVWSNGYGYADFDEKTKPSVNTIYILASITKTIVGTALMQLYEQRFFDLDDDVNTYLPFSLRNPSFPDDPITYRMLLSHTSSLNTNNQMQYYWLNITSDPPYEFFPEPYLEEFLVPGGRYYDTTVWSTQYRPGEHAMYANVGFDLISYLVELISGEPFLQYCDTHIFTPLQMQNTSFNLSSLNIEQVAVPYQRFIGRYLTIDQLTFMFGAYTPPERYYHCRFYPAGGLYSTVADLSHFLIAHMNNGVYNGTRILDNDTVALMHQIDPNNTIGGGLSYGLAWLQTSINGRITATGHAGDLPGADTWMLYNKTEDVGIIYLASGNSAYGVNPFRGTYVNGLILYSLFTKEGAFRGRTETQRQHMVAPLFPIKSTASPRHFLLFTGS